VAFVLFTLNLENDMLESILSFLTGGLFSKTTLIVLLVGMFIGWNIPQPTWAKNLWAKITGKVPAVETAATAVEDAASTVATDVSTAIDAASTVESAAAAVTAATSTTPAATDTTTK
jgi:hypothetical protein